tara:strand:+ start:2090 stop:2491 length:402 start_codon:yes stop_codon:yes gene_type:complete
MLNNNELSKKGAYYPRLMTSNKRGMLAFKELYETIKKKCELPYLVEIEDIQEFIKAKDSVININQLYTTIRFIKYLKSKDLDWQISTEPFPIENYEKELTQNEKTDPVKDLCVSLNFEKPDYVALIKSFCSLI